ncbi:hypothetical protein ROBYS_36880 [Roseobacter sp. OBYS 0001]|jgi:hypothetical protein|nr:hypothetical protein ROBYS_36880 [Roseobacter sp. OBYS 0001]
MDNRSDTPAQDINTGSSKECCGSVTQTEAVAETESRPTEDSKPEKAGKGGCCCSSN